MKFEDIVARVREVARRKEDYRVRRLLVDSNAKVGSADGFYGPDSIFTIDEDRLEDHLRRVGDCAAQKAASKLVDLISP